MGEALTFLVQAFVVLTIITAVSWALAWVRDWLRDRNIL